MIRGCETDWCEAICGACRIPLVGPSVAQIEFRGVTYEVRPCPRCGGAGTVPAPSDEELSRFYGFRSYRAGDGARFNAIAEWVVGMARDARRRRIERLAPRRGRLLDIGCGRGLFLRTMRRAGWEVAGVEADPEVARKISEAHGIDVRSGDPGDWGFQDGSFDAVTLHHVLEHIIRPVEMIARCRRLLRNGGFLVVAVPNRDSLQAALGGASWLHLDIPFHIHHFTAAGLVGLLVESGFRVVGERHLDLEQNLFGWVQTLLNRCGLTRNLLLETLKKLPLRNEAAIPGRGWKVAASVAFLPLAGPVGAVLTFVEAAARRGGTVEITAVKEYM